MSERCAGSAPSGRRSIAARRTTPCCCSPSAAPRAPTTSCRSWRTSRAGAASPRSGSRRSGSTTSCSAASARSTTQNRALLDALRKDFADHGLDLPVYWGNRNWAPVPDRHPARDGRRRRTAASWSSPPAPTPRTRAAASTARTSRTRSPRWRPRACELPQRRQAAALLQPPRLRRAHDRRRRWPRSPTCPRTSATAPTSPSPPTPSRPPRPTPPGPVEDHGDGGAYVAQHLDVARLVADARARARPASTTPGSSSTSRAPAPRTSRGWSPTSATTWRSCTAPARRPS